MTNALSAALSTGSVVNAIAGQGFLGLAVNSKSVPTAMGLSTPWCLAMPATAVVHAASRPVDVPAGNRTTEKAVNMKPALRTAEAKEPATLSPAGARATRDSLALHVNFMTARTTAQAVVSAIGTMASASAESDTLAGNVRRQRAAKLPTSTTTR